MLSSVGSRVCYHGTYSILPLRTKRVPRVKDARRHRGVVRINSMSSSGEENGNNPAVQGQTESELKQTVADLDAVLGIEEEEEKVEQSESNPLSEISKDTTDEILSLAEEMTQKLNQSDQEGKEKKKEEFIEKMVNIVENATENATQKTDGKKLLESLESLLESLDTQQKDSTADVQKLKEKVFSSDTFWVTETFQPTDFFGGYRFRGNLQTKSPDEAFQKIEMKTRELFGDKYEVFMMEEPLILEDRTESNSKPKICFQVVPGDMARPPESPNWQSVAAGVLFLFTLASSYILGVSSNVGNIPPAIVDYLSNPDNLNADEWPDFVTSWNPTLFLTSAGTIGISVMFLQLAHDLGHRILAFVKKIKLKGSLVLPSTQLGTLGSVTQLGSLVKSKKDLWDLSFAGLAAGGIASFLMLFAGLLISQDPSTPKEFLVPVPSVLLQGSTLIGGLLRTIIGEAAGQKTILLHPFTIAGWCGLSTTALNTLPVGNLDGGRIMYSAYGKNSLNLSSIFTYAGLCFGLIGSSVALPFALYVIICQRDPEIYIQNQVTSTDKRRQWITGVMIALSILILLPMGLFEASEANFGGPPLI